MRRPSRDQHRASADVDQHGDVVTSELVQHPKLEEVRELHTGQPWRANVVHRLVVEVRLEVLDEGLGESGPMLRESVSCDDVLGDLPNLAVLCRLRRELTRENSVLVKLTA
eukprot:3335199-Pyramimonas_sp.AAC.1